MDKVGIELLAAEPLNMTSRWTAPTSPRPSTCTHLDRSILSFGWHDITGSTMRALGSITPTFPMNTSTAVASIWMIPGALPLSSALTCCSTITGRSMPPLGIWISTRMPRQPSVAPVTTPRSISTSGDHGWHQLSFLKVMPTPEALKKPSPMARFLSILLSKSRYVLPFDRRHAGHEPRPKTANLFIRNDFAGNIIDQDGAIEVCDRRLRPILISYESFPTFRIRGFRFDSRVPQLNSTDRFSVFP